MKTDKLMISHGKITHDADYRWDCLDCIEVEIEYLKELKKAGGQTKFIEKISKLL